MFIIHPCIKNGNGYIWMTFLHYPSLWSIYISILISSSLTSIVQRPLVGKITIVCFKYRNAFHKCISIYNIVNLRPLDVGTLFELINQINRMSSVWYLQLVNVKHGNLSGDSTTKLSNHCFYGRPSQTFSEPDDYLVRDDFCFGCWMDRNRFRIKRSGVGLGERCGGHDANGSCFAAPTYCSPQTFTNKPDRD